MDAHQYARGEARGSQEEVSGRSGYIWLGDGASDAFEIKRTCRAPASRLREIAAWLSGAGRLRFCEEEDAAYEARVIKKVEFKRVAPGADPLYEFAVTFSCQPHPYVWPEAEPVEITESGTELVNPGTAPALPRIAITGSGSFSLSIGKQTLSFTGVEGGVIVDSELGDALTEDGSLLVNDKISGDLFEIQPGRNTVQWIEGGMNEEGDDPGSVLKVTITPRWRKL